MASAQREASAPSPDTDLLATTLTVAREEEVTTAPAVAEGTTMPLLPRDTRFNDHYRIIRQSGRGGFGFGYQAQ